MHDRVKELSRDLRIASAYGSSLLAEKDSLTAEVATLQDELQAAEEKLQEQGQLLKKSTAHNTDLYSSLAAADEDIGRFTTTLQVLCTATRCTQSSHTAAQEREAECARLRSELETEREQTRIFMRTVRLQFTAATFGVTLFSQKQLEEDSLSSRIRELEDLVRQLEAENERVHHRRVTSTPPRWPRAAAAPAAVEATPQSHHRQSLSVSSLSTVIPPSRTQALSVEVHELNIRDMVQSTASTARKEAIKSQSPARTATVSPVQSAAQVSETSATSAGPQTPVRETSASEMSTPPRTSPAQTAASPSPTKAVPPPEAFDVPLGVPIDRSTSLCSTCAVHVLGVAVLTWPLRLPRALTGASAQARAVLAEQKPQDRTSCAVHLQCMC